MPARRCRASGWSTVAIRSVAALMAFFTATRARSWLELAGRAHPPETCGAGELIQECVAFSAQGVQPAEVGPLFSFGEFLIEVAEPLPVGLEGLLVEDVAEL